MANQNNYAGITGDFTKNGTPNSHTAITPFIAVSNPTEAIAFYEKVFEAKTKSVTEFDYEGNKIIVHADIDFGNGFLQLGAANPDYGLVLPPGEGNACYSLSIYVADVDKTFALAVANGASVREPITNFVSGDRFCSILDPCGIRWSIMSRIEDISEEESYRRVAEWSKSQ
ncbi:VOC family protein [Bacillus horti]|uniref:Glyoxalase superfamily protein PhnB n=1 Tax=Caldalkalibacillus horti TaxID=77523 RepID=A0ABT9VWJ8_9BACI|nr:VOC family protein [Bacillus horti]MDQ0165344.1 putative glyoxalase superfamily protein PhnB [Bacillus horti]